MNPAVFVIAIICSIISGLVASGKNRNVAGYAALGFLLPLIGVIAALVVSPNTRPPDVPRL
jgi:uncharacterized membrane protein YgaE (UPF0421/DUF939 family)